MAYEMKDNSGSIFKNDKKEKETHPDYRGKMMVDGKEKSVSLWVKESKNGVKYFSMSIQEPYKKDAPSSSAPAEGDGLPF